MSEGNSANGEAVNLTARLVNPLKSKTIQLSNPVQLGDEIIEEVVVQESTVAEVKAFFNAMEAAQAIENDDHRRAAFDAIAPLGVDMPPEKWFAISAVMTAEDDDKVSTAIDDFTPRRLKAAAEQALKAGEATAA